MVAVSAPAPRPLRPLGPRLAAVLDHVPPAARLADVGADHAWLAIHAVACGRASWAVAIDRSPTACARARTHVDAAGARVDVRCGDGLAPLEPGEADTVAIAGMGGLRAVRILAPQRLRALGIRHLILAPHRDLTAVRTHLLDAIGPIVAEALATERGRTYVVVAARVGRPPGADRRATVLGPVLATRTDPAYARYVEDRRRALAADIARAGRHDDPRRETLTLLDAELERLGRRAPPVSDG